MPGTFSPPLTQKWVISNFGPVHSVALSLFGWITSYVAFIQHMWGRCIAHHFQDWRSKVKATWVVRSFYLVYSMASSLFDRIASYVAYIQHMRGRCVMYHFCHLSALSQWPHTYCKIFNIRRTKSENLSDCRIVLQLPLANPLKPGVKLRMKM